ncbi:Histidine kinase [Candidatus Desulfarcum epimagneticum]|uniref:Histidine kinase n=1 Tax=uncultured Desulfobacteraceae bacterium TaxID=218296 RepID=A0A484HB62_9BACT|nr:Histidine kinase [uncultured Desulfobacteraceae bacterium]
MKRYELYYDAIVKLTNAISHCRDPEEVALVSAESVKTVFDAKGCSVFLLDRETRELKLVASRGLSREYLSKGPIHFMQTITEAKDAVPIAIYDVMDDPRIEYPLEARKEGISSLLGVPIVSHNKIMGAMRLYTSEPWEFSIQDITVAQAVAQICGMAMDMCRLHKGYKTSIEILKGMRDPDSFDINKWTPHEGVPKSVNPSICDY